MNRYAISDRDSLLRLASWKRPSVDGRIILKLPGLKEAERSVYEERLNDLYFACGCELGAVFCVAGLVGYGLHVWILGAGAAFDVTFFARGFAVLLGAALTGKLVGLLHARAKLRKLATELATVDAQ